MFAKRVAVVTGGNRGIGREVVGQLAQEDVLVLLAARDRAQGLTAVKEFERQELPVRFHELDVTCATSIRVLGDLVEKEFGRCDILVNNAGIFPDVINHDEGDPGGGLHAPVDNIRKAMETNTCGPLLLCQRLIPLMRQNGYGRIVNVSSELAQLSNKEGQGRFLSYRVSKVALNMVTCVLAAELAGHNILVNSVTPGWCKTDMGGPYAPRDPVEGATGIVWLATLPDGGPSGGFFRDKKAIAW